MSVTWLVPFDPMKFDAEDPRRFSHLFDHVIDAPFTIGERSKCGIQVENLRPGLVFQRDSPGRPVCGRCEMEHAVAAP